jgi:glycosyltransferase involved in cell wall biosynthesis
MDSPNTDLSIVIPAYNEGDHIYANLMQVSSAISDLDYEILLVDDGSDDNTYEQAERAKADGCPVRLLRLPTNQGKGKALYHGASHSTGDTIAFLDADLEIDPIFIDQLLGKMKAADADVLIGAKSFKDSPFPVHRRWLSRLYQWLVAFLFGLPSTDTQTGIKLFKREVLLQAIPRLSVRRFAFDVELLIAATRLGYTIVEEPVSVTFKRGTQSGRIGLRHMLGMLMDTLAIYYRASFWKWLQPGVGTRLWMLALMIGILLFGIGVGKLITPLTLKPPIQQIFSILALQFLPRTLRDWLLVLSGGLLFTISLIILNRRIMDAFANRDKGDFQGILRKK